MDKLTAILHAIWDKLFPQHESPFLKAMFRIQMAKAMAAGAAHPGWRMWAGDSRQQEFSDQIDAMPNNICVAVSGSRLKHWIPVIQDFVTALHPECVIDDIGGNDFLAGLTADDVISQKKQLIARTRAPAIWIDIAGVSERVDAVKHVNSRIAIYNEWLASFSRPVAKVAAVLSPTGSLDPVYDVGDGVHYSAKAWDVIQRKVSSTTPS